MVWRKKCPNCDEYNYSVRIEDLWKCKECKEDISSEETESAFLPEEEE